jgi:hypothetical protein
MKKWLFIGCLLLLMASSWAYTVTIGTGTSTGRYPFDDFYVYSRSQCIYLASEIGVSGTITHLQWYRSDTGADPSAIGTTQIWLNTVTASAFTTSTWENTGTMVAEISNIDLGSGGGWYDVDITDYAYDMAAGNLQVSVYTQSAPFTSPHSYWYCTSTSPTYLSKLGNSDSANPPSMSTSYARPNIQLIMTTTYPDQAYNPSPANAAISVALSGNLTWNFGANTARYDLYFGPTGSEVMVVNNAVAGTTGSYAYSGLAYSTACSWHVVVRNSSGIAVTSPTWSFTTMAAIPVAASNPAPATGAVNAALNGALTWSFGANTSSYDLYFGPAGSEVMVVNNAASGTTGSYTYTGLTENTAYSWHVVSRNTLTRLETVGPTWTFSTRYAANGTFPVIEGFEGATFPSTGWSVVTVTSSGTAPTCTRETGGSYPTCTPHGGTYLVKYNSFNSGSGSSIRLTSQPQNFATAGISNPQVTFYMVHDTGYTSYLTEGVMVQASLDGQTWTTIASIPRYDATFTTAGWAMHTVNLGATYGVNGVFVGFLGYSQRGNNVYIDDVTIQAPPINGVFSINHTDTAFGNVIVGNTTTAVTYTVTNTGGGAMHITSTALSGTNMNQFVLTDTNTYPVTLAQAGTMSFTVAAHPTSLGAKTATLTVTDDLTRTDHVYSLTATGVTPFSITPSTATVDFGSCVIGVSTPQVYTITNIGTGPMSVNSVAISGTNQDQFLLTDTNTYPVTVAASGTMTFTVNFHPTSEGAKTATLTVTDGVTREAHVYTLTGTGALYCGASGGNCDEYIGRIVFGDIDNTSECALYNDYTAMSTNVFRGIPVTMTITNGNPYSSDQCWAWIDWNGDHVFTRGGDEELQLTTSDEAATFTGTFTCPATTAIGDYRMRVRMEYSTDYGPCGTANWGEVEDYTVHCAGSPDIPIFSASPNGYAFGIVTATTDYQTITVSNAGTQTLTITGAPVLTGDTADFDVIDTNTYPVALTTNTITYQVRFDAVTTGAKTLTMSITDDQRTTHALTFTGTTQGSLEDFDLSQIYQPVPVGASWNGVTSVNDVSAGVNYVAAEHFTGLTGPINAFRVWSAPIIYSGGWVGCTSVDSMTVLVRFFGEGANQPDTTNVLYSETVNCTVTDTGYPWGSYGTLRMLEGTLTTPPTVAAGYFAPQVIVPPSTCWLLWNSSATGDTLSWQLESGVWSTNAYDLAYALSLGQVLSPTNIVINSRTAGTSISWTASAGAQSYKVYTCDTPYAAFPSGWTLVGTTASTTYTTTPTDAKKFYRVTASTSAPVVRQ